MGKLENILFGSKEYKFEYGMNGMSVLKLTNYNTGETVKLDLSGLLDHEDVLQELIEMAEENQDEDY